jgi:hypothetical protein
MNLTLSIPRKAVGAMPVLRIVLAILCSMLRVAYNLNSRFTGAVSGQNLVHARQIQTSGPAVERRVLGTVIFNL